MEIEEAVNIVEHSREGYTDTARVQEQLADSDDFYVEKQDERHVLYRHESGFFVEYFPEQDGFYLPDPDRFAGEEPGPVQDAHSPADVDGYEVVMQVIEFELGGGQEKIERMLEDADLTPSNTLGYPVYTVEGYRFTLKGDSVEVKIDEEVADDEPPLEVEVVMGRLGNEGEPAFFGMAGLEKGMRIGAEDPDSFVSLVDYL